METGSISAWSAQCVVTVLGTVPAVSVVGVLTEYQEGEKTLVK